MQGSNYCQITPDHRVAQASNIAFDAATFEIWAALLGGATLVEAPQDLLLSPAHLAAAIGAGEFDILFLTTALFNQVASSQPGAGQSGTVRMWLRM